MLLLSCVILASCETTKIVESDARIWPQGTAHIEDTPTTQAWMLVYEEFRLGKISSQLQD